MMFRSRRRSLCAWIVSVGVLLAGAVWWQTFCANTPWLRAHNAQGTVLFSCPLPQGQEFGIRFTHSVARSPVEEWFVPQGTDIALRRTVYQDFGAGLPHEAAEGQRMVFGDGRIELSGFTLVLPRLEVRVGRVAGHELLLPVAPVAFVAPDAAAPEPKASGTAEKRRFTALPLAAWAEPGAVVVFSVGSPLLWEYIQYFTRMGQ